MSRSSIDLNADLGEGEPHDALLLSIVSSCNIACGGHTGDAQNMLDTVQQASRNSVSIGAHPSYPDREGFGRRSGFLKGEALQTSLTKQVESLAFICREQDVKLATMKAHGALYNDSARDEELAQMLATLAGQFNLTLIGLPDSATQLAAEHNGVPYRREGFVDRAYQADGSLSPRGHAGALIEDPAAAAEQALALASGAPITTTDAKTIQLKVDTLCLHGDTPTAADIAKAVRSVLRDAGIKVASPEHA